MEQSSKANQKPARLRVKSGSAVGSVLVVLVAVACLLGFISLFLRPNTDPGIRLWVLNHTPDQVVIINPFDGVEEKNFIVGDGLKELAFSRDYTKAYVINMVDVVNRFKVIDTQTYLEEETILVDGIPQGIGVFPDNRRMALIIGSKEDFMAGGFDVIDLEERSKADASKKLKLYRERDLKLSHKIACADDGDRIYCIDAKNDKIFIFSLSAKELVRDVYLYGAPEDMLYPPQGDYYYVSVLQHETIYQIDKDSDEIVGAMVYDYRNPKNPYARGKLRYMAMDSTGDYLFGTNAERKTVAIWEVGNPDLALMPVDPRLGYAHLPGAPEDPNGDPLFRPDRENVKTPQFNVPYYLPKIRFKLKGGYDPSYTFIPGGQQLAVDPRDDYLFVADEYGAIYVYDMYSVMQQDSEPETLEPYQLITTMADQTTELRDMKVCRPADAHAASLAAGGGA